MTLEELYQFNIENNRREFLYTIEILFYKKENGIIKLIKKDDSIKSNQFEEILNYFNICIISYYDVPCTIQIKKLISINTSKNSYCRCFDIIAKSSFKELGDII